MTTASQIFKTEDKGKSTPKKTVDGFQNFLTKLGVSPKGADGTEDNAISGGHYEFNLVTRNRVQLEAAYRGSWVVGQVVDAVAEDMTRAGIDITTNEDAVKLTEFKALIKRLQVWQSICEATKWGRLYGGAIAVMQIKGQDLSKPIDLDSLEKDSFKGLAVYDRWQLTPSLDRLIESGPDMGLPMFYDIVSTSTAGQEPNGEEKKNESAGGHTRVHHSRCIRIGGIQLPYFQYITESLWGESVLERMWDRLIMFDDATSNIGNLIQKALLRTVKVEGLRDILAAGGEAQEALIAQFDMMRSMQTNEGVTLMDKNDEFDSATYTFAGLSDVAIQIGQQVSGASQIPLVRLFGQSPAGMSATGESDIRLYYDGINARQESVLRNPLEVVVRVIWRSMTGKPAPKDLAFTFTPLWQMSATDKANVAKTNTDTIIQAHEAGGIDDATMMKELKQSSSSTGLFSHITDEMVEGSEAEEPPVPELDVEGQELGAEGEALSTAEQNETKEDTALNGAQVTSLVDIVKSVAAGELPRDSAVQIIAHAFQMSPAEAARILGKAGNGFKISTEEYEKKAVGDSAFIKIKKFLGDGWKLAGKRHAMPAVPQLTLVKTLPVKAPVADALSDHIKIKAWLERKAAI